MMDGMILRYVLLLGVLSACGVVRAECDGSCVDARGGRVHNICDYGAVADGVTEATTSIQRAIDACSAAGGGRVLVPKGTFLTYTLSLKNGVELHLDEGGVLKGGSDPLRYPPFPKTPVWRTERTMRHNFRAFLYTVGQTNVAITGRGTIDGNAEAFHVFRDGRWRRISDTNITGRCVFFVGCRGVRFEDALIRHPAGWSTWILDCDDVVFRRARIDTHREFPNGDGLHFAGCRDVLVEDCDLSSQDDAIVLRSHQEQMARPRPLERVTIRNCRIASSQSCAVRIGWAGDYAVKDILFENVECPFSKLGIRIELPPVNPRFCNDPPRSPTLKAPMGLLPFSVSNLVFRKCSFMSADSLVACMIAKDALPVTVQGIRFEDCRLAAKKKDVYRIRPCDKIERPSYIRTNRD